MFIFKKFSYKKGIFWKYDPKNKQIWTNLLEPPIFKKPVVSKPLNSKFFNENQQILTDNNLCSDEKTIICVIPKSSTSHHNKSYDCENDKNS